MSPPVTKPWCSKDLHSRWRCRGGKTERNARDQAMRTAREAARRAPLPDTTRCDCGLLLAKHPRCRGCTILAGTTHLEPALRYGRCASCVDFQTRRRAS